MTMGIHRYVHETGESDQTGGGGQFAGQIIFYDDFLYPDFQLNATPTPPTPPGFSGYNWRGEQGVGETLQIDSPGVNGLLQMSTPTSFAGPYLTLDPQTIRGIANSWSLYTRFKALTKTNAVYCIGIADQVTRFFIGNQICILISYFQAVVPNNFCLITQINSSTAFFYDTGILNNGLFHEWRLDADSVYSTLKLYHKNKLTGQWNLVVFVGNPAEIPLTGDMKLSVYVGDQNGVPPDPTETWTDVVYFEMVRDLSG